MEELQEGLLASKRHSFVAGQGTFGALDPSDSNRSSQLENTAADKGMAALMAEMQIFKAEAAAAEAKSRADRKVSTVALSL